METFLYVSPLVITIEISWCLPPVSILQQHGIELTPLCKNEIIIKHFIFIWWINIALSVFFKLLGLWLNSGSDVIQYSPLPILLSEILVSNSYQCTVLSTSLHLSADSSIPSFSNKRVLDRHGDGWGVCGSHLMKEKRKLILKWPYCSSSIDFRVR